MEGAKSGVEGVESGVEGAGRGGGKSGKIGVGNRFFIENSEKMAVLGL